MFDYNDTILVGGKLIIDNPELYNKAKAIADETYKKPSAYKSSFIVKKYKELGGTYTGLKPKKSGLTKWHKEEWKDIAGQDYPVYRPTKRINKTTPLTPEEIDPKNLKEQIKLKQKIKGEKNLPPFLKGGKISAPDLKGLLQQSYNSKKPHDYKNYDVDESLSDARVQVYRKKGTNEVYVVHRGTQGFSDWGTDLKALSGYDISNSNRFKHAEKIQKKAEKKYGAENVSTLGHSLAGKIASDVGRDSKEIITLNKFIPPMDIINPFRKKPSDKEYDIRSGLDPVSALLPVESGKNKFTIPSRSYDPLAEHKTDVLDRLPEDTMIGRGDLKKMSVKQLKDYIKKLPKNGQRFLLGGKKKSELIDYCCLKCELK
nr:MAG: hypothetical protein [Lake Baikal virophage 8]